MHPLLLDPLSLSMAPALTGRTLIVPRRRGWRVPLLMFAAALLVLAGARPASADACSSCKEPTLRDLMGVPGFTLHSLPPDWFGGRSTDYFEIDAGECTYKPQGEPTVTKGPSRLVLRGFGEVWNCPESSSEDEISFSISEGDSTAWTIDGEASAELSIVALKVAGKAGLGVSGGRTITEVRTVTKTLRAAFGHRIEWEGYFELATFSMTVVFDVTRRWSWWTKNQNTGYAVLRSGSIFMDCGSETVVLSRDASIGYVLRLFDRSCLRPLDPPRDLGLFPPVTTPPGWGPPGGTKPPPPITPPPLPPPTGPAPTPPPTTPPSTPPPTPPEGGGSTPPPPAEDPSGEEAPAPGEEEIEEETEDGWLDPDALWEEPPPWVNLAPSSPAGAPPTTTTCTAEPQADVEITLDGTVVAVLSDVSGADA